MVFRVFCTGILSILPYLTSGCEFCTVSRRKALVGKKWRNSSPYMSVRRTIWKLADEARDSA